jgi:putative hemolysin
VLHLLWRGIAIYAMERKARFLIGCSSLSSQNPVEGAAVYGQLQSHLVTPALRTEPRPEFAFVTGIDAKAAEHRRTPRRKRNVCACDDGHVLECGSILPLSKRRWGRSAPVAETGASCRLLRAYLAIGAKICGPPAIDGEFGTIDFLTLLDLRALPAIIRVHFLR